MLNKASFAPFEQTFSANVTAAFLSNKDQHNPRRAILPGLLRRYEEQLLAPAEN